ncbi:unnamed protein product [Orchesella dallaii]|uniref:Reticulocyte-binding protein 2 a n=1 Tax=Orchesella dallaii TaxID=48710 RepID=A0ABP1QJW6_9HEXA
MYCVLLYRNDAKCGKSSLREKFPFLYKAAEELDVECFLSENDLALLDKTLTGNMSEEEFKRCKKGLETSIFMNEVAHSKRTFAKLASSGFCVTQRGEIVFAEGTGTVRHEETTVTGKKGETLIKCKSIVKPQEVVLKNRVRKSTDEGQTTVGTTTQTTVSVKVQQQQKLPSEPVKPTIIKKSEDTTSIPMSKVADIDALVELIEGTHIKTSDPKKAAKKARQKEKKEMDRQRQEDELAKEERKKKLEELRQLELERKLFLEEQRRLEEKDKKEKAELLRKQKQAAEMKKDEQRRKREDVDRRKAEEKKLKKDAKKQRREQRKKELESPDGNEQEVETKTTQDSHEPVAKTEPRKCKEDKEAKKPAEIASEKDFSRIKHEKEQRKREEEEARRLEQLQDYDRAQANKKNKKKKKKQKHNSESNSQSASDASGQGGTESKVEIPEADSQTPPMGAPILDLINATNAEAEGKGTECNNLVTIRKHMDSTITISMKGKEGEKDLIYTLMNGQFYPTNNDGRVRSEDAFPLQQTTFVKPETVRPNHVSTPPATISSGCYSYSNPMGNVKPMGYSGPSAGHPVGHTYPTPMVPDNLGMGEIDLSQLKLPPRITITKVPQHLSGLRGEEMNMNSIQHPDYQPKPSQSMSEYVRISSLAGGIDARYNPNVMVVDSRCSSLESPIIGLRPSDTLYGANETRPSFEASVASDRPNSGMDSILNHNGMNPYAARPAFHSNEMLHARVPISLSSPFASASRNETPYPAWLNVFNPNPNINMIPGMIPSTSGVRTDAHGVWSSTPASPVAFPAYNGSEILKAQDQQYKFRGAGYGMVGEGSSTAAGFPPNLGMIPQITAQFKKVSIAPTNPASYAVGSAAVNGSSSPRAQPFFNSTGYRDMPIPPQHRGYDQRSPWDQQPDTSSPDASASPSSTSQAAENASEKDFGRIQHETEQRKREEEEARRLEQLQAHERAQANKKNKKKKKKKQKHNSESNSQSASDASGQGGTESKVEIPESQTPPMGAPILDLINANNAEAQGKGTECNNLVTIKKHMDSTITISMKGKEGEKDLIYTLMNGQFYPTNNDGRMRSEDALPLQQTASVKPETVRPNHVSTPPATISSGCYSYSNPMGNVKPMGYSGHPAGHPVGHTYPTPMVPDNSGMGEIDLSQLKLPPRITITKVPQHLSGLRGEEMNMNGIQHPDYQPKPSQSMSEYVRISSLAGGIDARYNPNVMVVDSRCSSLESPIIGIRPSDTLYGANGTRPSLEASVASDRRNSGMDSLMNHNGMNPYAARPTFHSAEMLHARVPVSLSSPFASASRNETPSPAWRNEFNPNPNMNGIPGMIPSTSGVRTDAHGVWSSNPASPVAFPASNVSEILKAQDQPKI